MTVLYRKYRPATFADVSGQEHVKKTLAHEVASGRLAHCYLFTGPRGTGKTTIARILAKAMNCAKRPKDSGDPCGACASCREIAEGKAIDVIEIDAASHTGVDNVREHVIENARFAPTRSPRKVFIIDEVHMLSTSAFNALLKTLEEPPKHAVFILATTESHKLPATVISRCQRFDFRKIGRADMTSRLKTLAAAEGAEVDDAVVEAVCRQSDGCLRDAESLFSQLLSLGEARVTLDIASAVMPIISDESLERLAGAIVARDGRQCLTILDGLVEGGVEPARIAVGLIESCRRQALAGLREPSIPGLRSSEWAALLRRLTEAAHEIRRAERPELPLELLIIEWTSGEMKFETPGSKPETEVRKPEVSSPVSEARSQMSDVPANLKLETIKAKWSEVLKIIHNKNQGLTYMLGAAELIECQENVLTIGFQYALYKEKLNDRKQKDSLEHVLAEVLGEPLKVKAVLVARAEVVPHIEVKKSANLPDGFSDLVKEFGGTMM
jgi:DNA polymerase-3 subunit gamma/tau